MHQEEKGMRGTTIIAVRRDGKTALAGDGQVTMGNTILKANAVKVRRVGGGNVLTGFAGSTADAFTLVERFEAKLKDNSGNLTRAAVELAKDWRTDKMLRRLDALLIVADREKMFLLTGAGDVVEPEQGIIAVGSGGSYALAAARAMVKHTELSAVEIAKSALEIAGGICVYTNLAITVEELG